MRGVRAGQGAQVCGVLIVLEGGDGTQVSEGHRGQGQVSEGHRG